jgi:uncharacterized protein YbcI
MSEDRARHEPPSRLPTGHSSALAISNAMVGMLSRYTGRGPTKARTTLNANIVVVAFEDTLTKGEQSLVAAGQSDAVHTMRRTFHQVMREEASSAIESILGRRVTACLSDVDPAANVAAMVFILDTRDESGQAEVADADGRPAGRS